MLQSSPYLLLLQTHFALQRVFNSKQVRITLDDVISTKVQVPLLEHPLGQVFKATTESDADTQAVLGLLLSPI
jgi:hypothetical protein